MTNYTPKLGNDLNMNAECRVLTEGKCLDFAELAALMKRWQVIMCVLDAQPERRKAYEFACQFWGHVKLCFYGNAVNGKAINVKEDDSHEITVDRTTWLDVSLNRFHNQTITLPQDVGAEYRSHIINQIRRYEKDKNGNPVGRYISIGPDHLGHARCYDEIALPCAASLTSNSDIRAFL